MARIDFDKQLAKGAKSYDKAVGEWWVRQSEDASHKRAYDEVAKHVAAQARRIGAAGGIVIDYACGNGKLLERLVKRLPHARLVGIDGSTKLLERNAARLVSLGHDADLCSVRAAFSARGPRVRLVQSLLPAFQFAKGEADVAVFCFPNITASSADQPRYDRNGYKHRRDVAVATMLARFREMDPEDEVSTWSRDEHYDDLMSNKVISRDLRAMLRKKGVLVRVEYSNCERHELSELFQWRSLFAEGALEKPIKEQRAELLFKYLRSRYRRSNVILDVYHQTGDKDDKEGGYFVADPACVAMIVTVGRVEQRVEIGLGAPCAGQDPPVNPSGS